jgi:hypothetical protein
VLIASCLASWFTTIFIMLCFGSGNIKELM